MHTFNNIQPGQSVTVTDQFPALGPGENCCDVQWTAQCGTETLTGSERVCVTPEPVVGACTAGANGIGKLIGLSSHMYTAANVQNWTNNFIAFPFTNISHTVIDSLKVHTVSRNSSYYNGNGGTFRLHLHVDAGGVPGARIASTPDYIGSTTLTSTGGTWSSQAQAQATYPNAIWSSYGETGNELIRNRTYDLQSPVSVTPCTRYWVIMERTTSTAHGVSLNGFFQGSAPKEDDPCFTDGDWQVIRSANGSTWSDLLHVAAFQINGNGMIIGNSNIELSAFTDSDRHQNINGSSAARQCWVPNKTMWIGQLRVQAARRGSGTSPLRFEIKNGSGSVLRSGSISGYPAITTTDIRQTPRSMQRRGSLFNKLQVQAGQQYYIELKTNSGTWYEISINRDATLDNQYNLDQQYYGWGAGNRAQTSTNNGASWSNPINWGSPKTYGALEADVGVCADGVTTCLEDCCNCIGTTPA